MSEAPTTPPISRELAGLALGLARKPVDVNAVQAILDAGWPVNALISAGRGGLFVAPLLWWAALRANAPPQVVQLLLERGADLNQRVNMSNGKTLTPFMQVCAVGAHHHLQPMLATGRVDLLTPDDDGWTPALHLVSGAGFMARPGPVLEQLQAAFEEQVLPGRPDLRRDHLWRQFDRGGRSALTIGGADVVSWLLDDARFDFSGMINCKTSRGETAMSMHFSDLPCLKSMLRTGALIDEGPDGPLAKVREDLEDIKHLSADAAPHRPYLHDVEAMLCAGLARQAMRQVLPQAPAARA